MNSPTVNKINAPQAEQLKGMVKKPLVKKPNQATSPTNGLNKPIPPAQATETTIMQKVNAVSDSEDSQPLLATKVKKSTSVTSKPSPAPRSTAVKREPELSPDSPEQTPPAKRARTSAENMSIKATSLPSAADAKRTPRPPPPRRLEVGTQCFTKPFSSSNATLRNMKVAVEIVETRWDSTTKQRHCLVQTEDPPMVPGTAWWTPEKGLESAMKKDEEVMVKIGGVWVEGIVEGSEKEADGWSYDCAIIGSVKVAGKDIKPASEGHRVKHEKVEKAEKTEKGEEIKAEGK